ncbi:uncharacterized protein LOC141535378 [Cotesia typhae]|uniref:uncharacterized protein LOC141535378 n=1 Tax=Cotesia typhae TaxID=2053667 RepID=UPI003D693338
MGGRKKQFARLWCLKNKEHYVVPLATIPKMHREIGKLFNYHRVENKLLEISDNESELRKKAIDEQSVSPKLPDDITSTKITNLAISNSNKRMIDDKIGLDKSIFEAKNSNNLLPAENAATNLETSLVGRTSSPTLKNKKQTSPVKNNVMEVQLLPITTSPPLSNFSSTTEPPSSASLVNLNETSVEEDGVLNLKTVPRDKSSTQSNVLSDMQQTTSPFLMEKNMTSQHTSSTCSPFSSTGTTHAQKTNELQSVSTSQSTVLDQTPEVPEYQNNFATFDSSEYSHSTKLVAKQQILPDCGQNKFMTQNSVVDLTPVSLAPENEFLTSNTLTFKKPLISPGLLSYFSASGSQFQQNSQINEDFNNVNSPSSFPNVYTDNQDPVVEQSLTNLETVDSSIVEDTTGHTSPVIAYKRLKTMHLPSSSTANVQNILRSNLEQLAVDNDQTIRTDIESSKSTIGAESETATLDDKLLKSPILNSNLNGKNNEVQGSSISLR